MMNMKEVRPGINSEEKGATMIGGEMTEDETGNPIQGPFKSSLSHEI